MSYFPRGMFVFGETITFAFLFSQLPFAFKLLSFMWLPIYCALFTVSFSVSASLAHIKMTEDKKVSSFYQFLH
jgi:hypothetical protein